MIRANFLSRLTPSLSTAFACGLCFAQFAAGATEEEIHLKQSDITFLESVQDPVAAKEKPPIGAFFAKIIETREEIEILANQKRYEDLFKAVDSFRETLDQVSNFIPETERQRVARFTAASRSLGQLSKAVQTSMWNGQEKQLLDAADKLGQLLGHIETLINPEELALAREFQQFAKG